MGARIRDAGYCHCAACKRATGSACAVWAQVTSSALAITRGEPASYPTERGARRFCARCGSPLWLALADGEIEVAVGSLDEPDAVAPRVHRHVAAQVPWLIVRDLLPWSDDGEVPAADQRHYYIGPPDPSVTRDAPITLREIDEGNARAVLMLRVTGPQQRFVASNAMSLAQARYRADAWPRAVYAGDTPVGFAMLNIEHEDFEGLPLTGEPFIWRFMIDARYQRMGFGRRVLDLVIAEVATWGDPKALWLSSIKAAGSPYEFYRRHGFVDTNVEEEGEWIMRRAL